jgi:YVTN family beta-propeller protein
VSVVEVARARALRQIKVQDKPNDLLLTRDGARLFVANGNRNTISVIDTARGEVVEQIEAALRPKAPLGSTPNALALTPDGKTLLVANADNNALAVIDISRQGGSAAHGFIPTGWYPTAVPPARDLGFTGRRSTRTSAPMACCAATGHDGRAGRYLGCPSAYARYA